MFSKKEFLKNLEEEFSLLRDWFIYLRQQTAESRWIHEMIDESPEKFEQNVLYLSEGIRLLPTRPIRLSVFSQIITLDANAFNVSNQLGKLWLHVLAETKRVHAIEPVRIPSTKQSIDDLLQGVNLYREDITDAVTIANLFAETASGYHPVWESAVHSQSVLTVPLREIIKLNAVYPAHEKLIVWVIDNPEVFTRILDEVPNVPMICTQGKWTCATWEVFDRLEEIGAQLRFAGDLTPESIVRAEEVLLHYPKKSETWKMDISTYLKARDEEVILSNKDLDLLNKNHLDYLACVKDEMKDRGNPAYLMKIIDEITGNLKYFYRKE